VPVHGEAGVDAQAAIGGAVQAKFRIGRVDDPLEQEADRAAEQVSRPDADVSAPRLSPAGGSRGEPGGPALSPGGFQPSPDGSRRPPTGARSVTSGVPGIVHQVLRSPGQPLDAASRAYFEPRFGHDFSQVRVHADEQAAASARALGALAFTAGRHVVFGTGSYGHGTEAGRKLLAHELAHTIQQSQHPEAAHGAAAVQRAPADDKPQEFPELTEKTDPRNSPHYIDEVFDSVTAPSILNGATTFFWGGGSGAQRKKITIALKDIDQDDKQAFAALWKIHATKDEALKTVELYRRDGSGFAYYSFYLGKEGVIMPTSFSLASTPKFHALWPDLRKLQKEEADDLAKGFGQLANAINPIPCTAVDENGHLRAAINFGSCLLPLALHGYAIHSARGPSARAGEPPVPERTGTREPPPKTPTETKPPAQTPGENKPPAATEPVQVDPAKTESTPAGSEQTQTAKTEQEKSQPEKTQPKRAAVRTPAELERYLEELGLSSEQIRALAGGKRRGQFSQARAALIERLLGHFTPEDMKALGTFFAEHKATLNNEVADALIDGIAPGGAGDWTKSVSIAQSHGEATKPPEAEGALEESLGEEQDPNARISVTKKKKPSPGRVPRQFLRGNFAHRFAEYLLDAVRLPRPSQAEVVVELRDGTGDIIRTDRIISHADHGELLEIKPAGRSAEIGAAQLPGRLAALQREFPKPNGWHGQIVEYTPADVRAWLQREAQAAKAAGVPVPDVEGIMKLFGF
jgi:hypothetical protein